MRNLGPLTCSLEELQRRFAVETDTWLRQKLETGSLSAQTATAFVKARERCARRLKRKHQSGLIPTIREFLTQTKTEARNRAVSNLNRMLGTFVERFGAASGSLFVVRTKFEDREGGKVLEELLAHNVPTDWKKSRYPLTVEVGQPCGITVLSAYNKQGYIADDVINGNLKMYYRNAIPTTLSEMAVPIFSLNGEEVEGVINLESDEPNAFLPFYMGELQAASSILLPDMLILKHLENVETSVGWHPDIHGWKAASIFQQLCDKVSTSQSLHPADQRLICTIWHADWPKASLHVKATARFNFEFIAQRIMPLQFQSFSAFGESGPQCPKIPVRSWMHDLKSFTGLMAAHERGHVKQGRVADMPSFNRPDRAARMGIEYIITTPIYIPQIVHQTGQKSSGVLSLYFFRREQPRYSLNIAGAFPEPDVAWLADVIGSITSEIATLKTDVAAATLLARVREEGIPHLNLFDTLRDSVIEFLAGDGCTIFLTEAETYDPLTPEIAVKVIPLSTTGLIEDNETSFEAKTSDYKCALQKPSDLTFVSINGITAFLTVLRSGIVRKTDVQDPWETGSWQAHAQETIRWSPMGVDIHPETTLMSPSNITREKTEPTESDHRRVLAVSTPLPLEKGSGLIRLVRKPSNPPFFESDGELLAKLAQIFNPYFLAELEYHEAAGMNDFEAKLNARDTGSLPWNGHYTEALLQYLIKALTDRLSSWTGKAGHCFFDLAYLRVRSLGGQGQKTLRLYTHFSREARQIISGRSAVNISDTRSLEWYVLDQSLAIITSGDKPVQDKQIDVVIDKRRLSFQPFNSQIGDHRFAIFVPFSIDSSDTKGDILLCLEGRTDSNDPTSLELKQILQNSLGTICQFAKMLNCIGRNNTTDPFQDIAKEDSWISYTDILDSIKQLLSDKEDTILTENIQEDQDEFRLWYGIFPIPHRFFASCKNVEPSKASHIVQSSGSLARRYWRELVLGRRFSPFVISHDDQMILDDVHFKIETHSVEVKLDSIIS